MKNNLPSSSQKATRRMTNENVWRKFTHPNLSRMILFIYYLYSRNDSDRPGNSIAKRSSGIWQSTHFVAVLVFVCPTAAIWRLYCHALGRYSHESDSKQKLRPVQTVTPARRLPTAPVQQPFAWSVPKPLAGVGSMVNVNFPTLDMAYNKSIMNPL